MRAVNEQFLGHAAADDTGAADPILLRHRDARAVRGRDARGADAARTRADDEEIIVEIAHGKPLKWTGEHSRPAPMWLHGRGLPIEICGQAQPRGTAAGRSIAETPLPPCLRRGAEPAPPFGKQ